MNRKWLIRRVGFLFVVLFISITLNFMLPRLMPGGAEAVYGGGSRLPEAAQEATIRRFGLDKPVLTQYVLYIRNILVGDLGLSWYFYPTSVGSKLASALPWTLYLLITSTILSIPLGYFLGAIAGWQPGSKRDVSITGISLALLSTPLFWIGMILLFIFGYQLGWFPLGGAKTIAGQYANWFEYFADISRHAVLPIIALLTGYGGYMLIMRNTMVTTIKEDYVLIAEAKGLSENEVKYKHAARNALLPLVTSVAIRFAIIIGGSVFIETIFSYPGVGKLLYEAVIQRDFPLLQGGFVIFSVVTVCIVFLLDLVYLRLDPRIRY